MKTEFDSQIGSAADAPLPLFRKLREAQDFPVDVLPGDLKEVIGAIAEITQAPIAIAAQSILMTVCLCEQPYANVRNAQGGTSPLSLYFLTIAESGARKTSADNEALAGVVAFEEYLRTQFQANLAIYHRQKAIYDAEKKLIEKEFRTGGLDRAACGQRLAELGPEPSSPVVPSVILSDFTMESSVHALNAYPSVAITSSEGATFLRGQSLTDSERKMGAAAQLNLMWDGGKLRRRRVGEGVTTLNGRRVAMHVLVQPNIAQGFLSDRDFQEIGLTARLLIVQVSVPFGERFYRKPSAEARAVVDKFAQTVMEKLRRPLPYREGTSDLNPPTIELEEDAALAWERFYNAVEKEKAPGGQCEQIRAFAEKVGDMTRRFATILARFEDPSTMSVPVAAMLSAITVMQHYLGEAARLADSGKVSPELQDAEKLRRWLLDRPSDSILLKDVYQYGPRFVRTVAAAKKFMRILAEHGHVVPADAGRVWTIVREG